MQLTRFTDLGLRVLMYLSQSKPDEVTTIGEITQRFNVPHNHLTKVVQFMGQKGWLHNLRGKGGGIQLAKPPSEYRLGEVIRTLEHTTDLINCNEPPCALSGQCLLKGILGRAKEKFYRELDLYTLADAIASPTGEAIVQLRAASPAA